ncbi:MAG: protein kinase [Ardenticatenaceae bacterium]|nr:protein kinase [Ardenticatenaceae bacterium]
MNEAITFGQIVRERRSIMGLTQTELARRVGCAAITIRKIEADDLRPSVQMAELIALALNIPEAEQLAFVRLARAESEPSPIPTPSPLPAEIGLTDLSGRAVKGFQLGEKIGSGGFGVVYRALQPSVERDVAVKIILPRYANHPNFIRRFETEAQLIAQLEHPHIVPLYDYWREPDAAYLIMRLLRGGSVEDLLKEGAIPAKRVYRYTQQIGLALDVAHRHGVVHRDIKPANVLLDEEDNAYLADFGIAKNLEKANGHSFTEGGVLIGSPAYISPEQILSEPVKPQSDVYCMGIMLYEMLTGHKPFSGPTPIAYIEQHLHEKLPSLHKYNQALPPALDEVIQQATKRNPADRFANVPSLLAALQQALAGSDGLAPVNVIAPVPMLDTEALANLENPYRGLRAFTEADAEHFYGRETLIQELFAHLSDTSELKRFLAIVGPSGSGKSSVAKAGLVPALRRGGLPGSEDWFVLDFAPGAQPWEELEAALLRVAVNPPATLLDQLQDGDRGLLRTVKRVLPDDGTVELVLIIDQFEEIFTLVEDEKVREQFLNSLITAVLDPRSRLWVITTLRADFYDRPLQYVDFGDLLRQRTVFVLPLTPDELEQAITRPAAQIGVQLEPGLAAAIIRDVGDEPGTLPLLQYALTELFERRKGVVLTRAAYEVSGGALGALSRRAEEIYANLGHDGQEATRQLFLRLITLGEGTEDTRRRVLRSELEAMQTSEVFKTSEVLDAYGRYRLLTFDHDPTTREPTVEVAHEALLREWPRLRGWLANSRDDVRLQRLLANEAQGWQTADHDPSYLLRGTRLAQLENWAETTTVALTQDEQTFLQASLALQEARQVAEEDRRQRELATAKQLAETERQRAEDRAQAAVILRRRAVYLGVAAVLAVILAVTAGLFSRQASLNEAIALANEAAAEAETLIRATAEAEAIAQRDVAQTQTNLAVSRELALAALNNLEADPELSILLALQALKTRHTKEAEEALHLAIQTSRALITLLGHTESVEGAAYSPDGSQVATVSLDGTVKVWQVATGQLQQTLPYEGVEFVGNTLKFDEAGSRLALLAVGDNYETVNLHIWDAESGALLSQHEMPIPAEFFRFELSPDWQWLAVGRDNGIPELWDVVTGERVLTLAGHEVTVDAVAFSADSSRLVTADFGGQVQVWDVAALLAGEETQPELTFTTMQDFGPGRVFFSNDGLRLAFVFNTIVEIWDLADTSQPQFRLKGHNNAVHHLAFTADDALLATASADSTAKVWDLNSGEELFTLSGHKATVFRLAFSPDGRTLTTASTDGTARIWNAARYVGGELQNLALPDVIPIGSFDLSPDEQTFALGGFTGATTIRDSATGDLLLTLQNEFNTLVGAVSFHPDGSRLATASQDGLVRIWDTTTGELLLQFTGHVGGNSGGSEGVLDVTYSPDGTRLATAGADGLAKVWNAATGEELLELAGHTAGLFRVAYSADGRILATTSDFPDTTVKVWDAQSGEMIHSLGPNPSRSFGLAFSPDDKWVAAGGGGGFLTVWDVTTGKVVSDLTGQSSALGTTLFTQDGQRLITGGVDGVSIWDIESGTELVNLAPLNSAALALTTDERQLYMVPGLEPVVRVYTIELEDAIALAESRLTRWWTEEECRQFLHVDVCPVQE